MLIPLKFSILFHHGLDLCTSKLPRRGLLTEDKEEIELQERLVSVRRPLRNCRLLKQKKVIYTHSYILIQHNLKKEKKDDLRFESTPHFEPSP